MAAGIKRVKGELAACPLAEQLGKLGRVLVASEERSARTTHDLQEATGVCAALHVCEEMIAHIVEFVLQHRVLLRLRHDHRTLPELVRCDVGGGMCLI